MELEAAENPGRFFTALSRDLKSIALSNIQYFQNGKQSHHAKFHVAFSLLYEYLDVGIEPSYGELSKFVGLYDFSPQIKGNGYRSLLRVVQKCCLHLLQLCRYISSVRDSILFRKKFYAKELESYVSALGQLRAVLYYALKLNHYCQDGELFVDESKLNNEVAEQLVLDVENLSQESFYGRCLGFQFCQSMQRPLQVLAIAMASYSEGYLESSQVMQVATSVFNSGKYILDPELRAQQMVKVTRTADIKFCKAFWGFSEATLMQQLPSFVCPPVEVNEVIVLGPDSFDMPLIDGSDTVVITPPCAHSGPGHVYTRLISAHLRDGQHTLRKTGKLKTPTSTKPKASGLVIHIHGGGFVAQSSKSHEVYLREWAVTMDIPILSVDYSLAPELPFPRALEECFYAYAWAVQNCAQLGSTGEKIIFVGDSAGGNLAISTAMRAASFGIRPPDGILAVYPCTVVRYTLSPARLLSLMDPVLPIGLITKCLAAYAGINEQQPMASPRMDDVHSQQSLTSIQMELCESMDNDWIIIAQDKDEVNKIRSHIGAVVLSPDINTSSQPASSSQTVTDSKQNIGVKSEKEIFSQLENDGSFTFPCDTQDVVWTGSDQVVVSSEENANVNQSELRIRSSSAPKMARSHLGMFQERARLVVEGAQTMLTKVSSYIPTARDVSTQDVVSSLSSLLPANSAASEQPAKVSGKPEYFSDMETSSDPVDDFSVQDFSSLGGDLVDTDKSDECVFQLTADTINQRDHYLKEGGIDCSDDKYPVFLSESFTSALSSPRQNDSTSKTVAEQGSCAAWLDNCPPVSNSTSVAADDDQMISPIDDLSAGYDVARVISLSLSTTSSSQAFDTALSSPFEPAIPELPPLDNSESTSLYSDSCTHQEYHLPASTPAAVPGSSFVEAAVCDDVNQSSLVKFSKSQSDKLMCHSDCLHPDTSTDSHRVAVSDTSLYTVNDSHVVAVNDTCLETVSDTCLETVSDTYQDTVNNRHQIPVTDICLDTVNDSHVVAVNDTCLDTVSDTPRETSRKHKPSLNSALRHEDSDLHDQQMSLEFCATVFCLDDLVSGPLSPSLLPNLPDESQHLLEDAVQTDNFPFVISPEAQFQHIEILQNDALDNISKTESNIFNSLHNQEIDEEPKFGDEVVDHEDHIALKIDEDYISLKMNNGDQSSYKIGNEQTGVTEGKDDFCDVRTEQTGVTEEEDDFYDVKDSVTGHIKPVKPSSLNLQAKVQPDLGNSRVLSPSTPSQTVDQENVTSGKLYEINETKLTCESCQPKMHSFMCSSPKRKSTSSLTSYPTTSRSEGFLKQCSVSSSTEISQAMIAPSTMTSHHVHTAGKAPADFEKQNFTAHSPLHTLRKTAVVSNPYMSPLLATDELLRGLPMVSIVACHLDPLLDDSVMFARRLRSLQVPVNLHLVDDLPHGFLNFAMLSFEAKQAADLCGRKMSEMLQCSDVW